MKYLKLFNESLDEETEELQEFCDMNLAYLIDEGFKIKIVSDKYSKRLYFTKGNGEGYDSETFEWDEIKNSFIPFLTLLERRYGSSYRLGESMYRLLTITYVEFNDEGERCGLDTDMISLDDIIDVNDGDVGIDSIICIEIILRNQKYVRSFNEKIELPIEIGDTVLGGRFKNKKIVVKKIGKNKKGDITINDKPLLKFRIVKK
jgi:hypothetical protein